MRRGCAIITLNCGFVTSRGGLRVIKSVIMGSAVKGTKEAMEMRTDGKSSQLVGGESAISIHSLIHVYILSMCADSLKFVINNIISFKEVKS